MDRELTRLVNALDLHEDLLLTARTSLEKRISTRRHNLASYEEDKKWRRENPTLDWDSEARGTKGPRVGSGAVEVDEITTAELNRMWTVHHLGDPEEAELY